MTTPRGLDVLVVLVVLGIAAVGAAAAERPALAGMSTSRLALRSFPLFPSWPVTPSLGSRPTCALVVSVVTSLTHLLAPSWFSAEGEPGGDRWPHRPAAHGRCAAGA